MNTIESAHDILRAPRQPLDVFFRPRNVAVIGATEKPGSVGRTLMWNLLTNPWGGTVFPVNPQRSSILGVRAYRGLNDLPAPVDLAVIVTPAASVPGLVAECVAADVRGAIIISAGFAEAGAAGRELEDQIRQAQAGSALRIVGPNCLGVMSPTSGVNATFAAGMARPGNVALLSQSGALLTAVLDWATQEHVGFSAVASLGSMLDVGWGDLIDYLGDDPATESIVIYMESVGNARAFLSATRAVALRKPIIIIKAGRTEAAAHAAASHTGALSGSDEVLAAALRRSGVMRVQTIAEVFAMAEVLAKQPLPAGNRLAIVTNAGGPGVLATDTLVAGSGELAELSTATLDQLNRLLPAPWSHGNPVDVLGDAPPERYAQAVEVVARDKNADGLLVILTPQAMTDPTATADRLRNLAKLDGKPILASWMGGPTVAEGRQYLRQAGIPTFDYPDMAVRAFNYMSRYRRNLQALYETPLVADADEDPADRVAVAELLAQTLASGRTLLTEYESKRLLTSYRIPTVPTSVAAEVETAVAEAQRIGFPVVLKLHSYTLTHKTDVGGVQLNLATADEVRRAFETIRAAVAERAGTEHFLGVTVQPMVKLEGYELILGSSCDPQFGPVLLFGSGGQLVEVFRDRSLGLPPLNTTLARRVIERTKIAQALAGVRGRAAVDMPALQQMLVRFSYLVVEQPRIKEIDINPLLAGSAGLLALDARVVLHPAELPDDELPRPAIRPYPTQYVRPFTLRNGQTTVIRPIRPTDEPLLVRFHEQLSPESVYLRYFQALQLSQRVKHDRLARLCSIDFDREIALVAEGLDAAGQPVMLGIGRLTLAYGTKDAEFALLVADALQRQGLGREILRQLIEVARAERWTRIIGHLLATNRGMLCVCEQLGFACRTVADGSEVVATLVL